MAGMRRERYEPMTLGNMRQNGVRTLAIYCGAMNCHHQGIVDVEQYADNIPVPSFRSRMRCTVCGHRGADARPNWSEQNRGGGLNPGIRPLPRARFDERPLDQEAGVAVAKSHRRARALAPAA